MVRAIGAAQEAIVSTPVLWARARGFADVTPAILGAVLAIKDEGTTVERFRAHRSRSKQAASHLLGELRRRGYVKLVSSPSDGRAKVVMLTVQGAALRTTCLDAERRLSDAIAMHLGAEALTVAASLLALAAGLACDDPGGGDLGGAAPPI